MKLLWIPVEVTYFTDRQSKMARSIWKYVNNSAKIILKAVRDVRPMKFFGIPGVILMTISFFLFIAFLSFYLQDFKITPYRNYLFASAITFVVGLQFFVFALLADMVKSNRKLTEEQIYLAKKKLYRK